MLVGLFAIPQLITILGLDRFGVLAIAWIFIGYFSIFDFGLGRALTKMIAERTSSELKKEIPFLVVVALLMMIILGFIAAFAIILSAEPLVRSMLNIPVELQAEAQRAFIILGFSIPLVILSSGIRGVLEGYHRFDIINLIRTPLGIWTFLGPLLFAFSDNSIDSVVTALFIGRLTALIVFSVFMFSIISFNQWRCENEKLLLYKLLGFGGWTTVTNIVGPLMVYLDRFIIGMILTMTAVAFYTTPYEIVTRLWIAPTAIAGVLFPALAHAFSDERDRVSSLLGGGITFIALALFPVILLIVTFPREILLFWVGAEFADNSADILRVLAIGVYVNSIARIPFIAIQAFGKPDIIAKVHLLELPFYLLLFWVVLEEFGLIGAAILWTARIMIDTLIFFIIATRIEQSLATMAKRQLLVILTALTIYLLPIFLENIVSRAAYTTIIIALMLLGCWKLQLKESIFLVLQDRQAKDSVQS